LDDSDDLRRCRPGGLLVVPGVKIAASPGRLIMTAK